MKGKFILPLILLIVFFASLQAQPVNQTGFESFASGMAYTKSSWEADGFTVPWVNGFNQDRAFIDDAYAHSGTKSLRLFFPAGEFGPSGTGGQAPLIVPAASQYYISYWLRFSDDFSWGTSNQGGKLPGLAGGARCSGCAICDGTNGFSARLMWRTGGKAVLYLYHMDKINPCGDDLALQITPGTDFIFQRGEWHQVIQRVKVNTGNNFDGEVELWINGQPALLAEGLRFVSNGDQVDNLYFSTFHGGNSTAWAPVTDSYIWFDDIMITTNVDDIFSVNRVKDNNSDSADLKIYPQPLKAGESFSIELSGKDEITDVQWLDLSGKLIYTSGGKSSSTYKIPSLVEGMYFLRVHTGSNTVTKQVYIIN